MDILPYVFISVVGLVSGIISGITGGGGAMLMIPALILTGLPPQAAVATAKLSGLGTDFGGLGGFLRSGHIRIDIVRVMIPVAIIIGLITPLVFTAVESGWFQIALAVVMILLLPTLFIKKTPKPPTRKHKSIGYILYSCVLFLQGIFSGGIGGLATYVLTLLFGLSKLQTMATRRVIVATMSPVALVALYFGGFLNIWFGLAGLVPAFVGTYMGTKIVLRRGDTFVSIALAATILVSSITLILTA